MKKKKESFGQQAVRALNAAIREEARKYKRDGMKMVMVKNGRVVEVSPDSVLKSKKR